MLTSAYLTRCFTIIIHLRCLIILFSLLLGLSCVGYICVILCRNRCNLLRHSSVGRFIEGKAEETSEIKNRRPRDGHWWPPISTQTLVALWIVREKFAVQVYIKIGDRQFWSIDSQCSMERSVKIGDQEVKIGNRRLWVLTDDFLFNLSICAILFPSRLQL